MFELPRLTQKGLVSLSICAHLSREKESDADRLGRDLYVMAEVGKSSGESIVASKFVGTEQDGVKHYHIDAGLESTRRFVLAGPRIRTSEKSRQEVLTPPKALLGKELKVTIWGIFRLPLSKLPDSSFIRVLADVSIRSGNANLTIQGCAANVSGDDEIVELRWSFEGDDNVMIDIAAYHPLAINDETFRKAQSIVENGLRRLVLGGSTKKQVRTDDK